MPASQTTTVAFCPHPVEDLDEHAREPEDRVVVLPLGGRDRLGQREERPIDEAVAVDQKKLVVGHLENVAEGKPAVWAKV